ncbi:MAG: putative restriction-modification system methyltransferase [Ignavibacteria bacterium]|nr:putative restriction-modification system methyltransferase [Ignavibacteria bacterium]
MNRLHYGDCLEFLKAVYQEYPKGYIDLIYIDPPFNSKRNYNILFESIDLKDTKAQKEAFKDTWSNVSYQDTINEIQDLDIDLYKFLMALNDVRISKSIISYLTMMTIRIWYIHKVLKSTGSFYLHCDPNMSHYLKIICDLIFGKDNYQNNIIWKRTSAHSNAKKFGWSHDEILYYVKSHKKFTWNQQFQVYDEEYVETYYRYIDEKTGKKFMSSDLAGHKGINKEFEWKGITRPWRYPIERLNELEENGKIFRTKNNFPRFKRFLDDAKGLHCQDTWYDIEALRSWSAEGLGYPTQKPLELLERIILASTNEGDLVADFFCGCGTTVAAAQILNRNWIGVDISHLAINLIRDRLINPYSEVKRKEILANIEITGLPKDIASSYELAKKPKTGRFDFQNWVIEVLLSGTKSPMKTGDGGRDGYITFSKSSDGKHRGSGIIEVKSGNVSIGEVRAFMSSVEAFKADMGIFVCYEQHITKGMRIEAKAKGCIPGFKIDKIQIISVNELMEGAKPKLPGMTEIDLYEKSIKKLDKPYTKTGFFKD